MGPIKANLYRFAPGKAIGRFTRQSVFPYYHIVKDVTVPHIEHLYPYKGTAAFRADLDFLLQHYKPLHPSYLTTHTAIPERHFLLTFDDGLSEIYTEIFPILKEKGVSAIFFLNPDFVGNEKSLYKHDISVMLHQIGQKGVSGERQQQLAVLLGFDGAMSVTDQLKAFPFSKRELIGEVASILGVDVEGYRREQRPYVTKEQILEMHQAGFYFGGHTMSHPPLQQLGIDEQEREIVESIRWVQKLLSVDYSFFAFPFSDKAVRRTLLDRLFAFDPNIRLFGNSGMKKDVDLRLIQRFSLENPKLNTAKLFVAENLYKTFNKLIGKYKIERL